MKIGIIVTICISFVLILFIPQLALLKSKTPYGGIPFIAADADMYYFSRIRLSFNESLSNTSSVPFVAEYFLALLYRVSHLPFDSFLLISLIVWPVIRFLLIYTWSRQLNLSQAPSLLIASISVIHPDLVLNEWKSLSFPQSETILFGRPINPSFTFMGFAITLILMTKALQSKKIRWWITSSAAIGILWQFNIYSRVSWQSFYS